MSKTTTATLENGEIISLPENLIGIGHMWLTITDESKKSFRCIPWHGVKEVVIKEDSECIEQ